MDERLLGSRGWTPLHRAVACRIEVQTLEDQLKRDASKINRRTGAGETPLLMACHYMCVEVAEKAVSLLLYYDADANLSDNQGRTPLLFAAMKGKLDVVATLLNSGRAEPDVGDSFGHNPMYEAALGGHWDIVECLLRANASVIARSTDRVTPVYLAAEHGQSACLEKLLRLAMRKGQQELVDLCTVSEGITPLMAAAKNGHVECVRLLLKYSADPNLRTEKSSVMSGSVSAVHMAVYGDRAECVKLLLEKVELQDLVYHADCTCTEYVCPLLVAVDNKSHESLKILLSLSFPVDNIQYRSFSSERIMNVRGRPNLMYVLTLPDYQTSLSHAAALNDIDSMKILLDYGASTNSITVDVFKNDAIRQERSLPPVLSAVLRDTWEALDLLIEHGCDISFQHGIIPSNQCLLFSLCDYDSTKKLLLCGSDPRLLFQPRGDIRNIVTYVSFILGIIDRDVSFQILELLLQFTEISGPVQRFFRNVSDSCQKGLLECGDNESYRERWEAILQQVYKPSSLESLCRVKIRRLLISIHGYSSFRRAINNLCLLKKFKVCMLPPITLNPMLDEGLPNSSSSSATHCLNLPQVLKDYLLYSDINEDREHT